MNPADQLLFTVSYDQGSGSTPFFHDHFFENGYAVRHNAGGATPFRWQVRYGRLCYRVEDVNPEWTPETEEAQAAYERYLASVIVSPA